MTQFATFRLLHCPRYEDIEADAPRAHENLLSQQAFVNTLRHLPEITADGAVELTYIADAVFRRIHPFLTIYAGGSNELNLHALQRILPIDYGWKPRLFRDGNHIAPPPLSADQAWHTVRLKRRMEIVNLPRSDSQLYPESAALVASTINQNMYADNTHASPLPGVGLSRSFPPLLPLNNRQRQDVHDVAQICVPLLAPIEDASPDRRRFCEEMQAAAPCVVSLKLIPVVDRELTTLRMVAGSMRPWFSPFAREMQNSGLATRADLFATFDRFAGHANNLWRIEIQVAAPTDAGALGIAHAFSANFGGARAFEADLPIVQQQQLRPIGGSNDSGNSSLLSAAGVDPPEAEYLEFLHSAPEIFDLSEAAIVWRLPYGFQEGLPGIETRLIPPFHAVNRPRRPTDQPVKPGEIRIGKICDNSSVADVASDWHCLPVGELSKHALVVGKTGSGKSVTTEFLLRDIDRAGVEFLVIEPVKTEYYDALTNRRQPPLKKPVRRWGLEGKPDGTDGGDFLIFDPLRLQTGVSVARHISHLKSCFAAAFPLNEVFALILENGLYAYYTGRPENGACGWRTLDRGSLALNEIRHDADGRPRIFPSFDTFGEFFIRRYLPHTLRISHETEFARDAIEAFTRRFINLKQGPLGIAFRRANDFLLQRKVRDDIAWNPFELLLQGNTVLELDAVADDGEKALVMAFILTFLFEKRQAEDLQKREAARNGEPPPNEPMSSLRHLLVLEEAHRLLKNEQPGRNFEFAGEDSSQRAISLFVDMLSEIRAYRQGLMIVEQIPTRIVPDAVKNTNLKIMMSLNSEDDRDFLGEAMYFNDRQKRFVNSLKTGQCVVFAEDVETPVMLEVPPPSRWCELLQ